jgi:transcriptional regulator with XRE-family HTH domain
MGGGLGRFVGDRRAELGLSRKELADASGLSYPYVSQIETGEREPALKAMRGLAAALDVPVEQLAGLTSPAQWMTSAAVVASSPTPPNPPNPPNPPSAAGSERRHETVLLAVERRLREVPPLQRLALLSELTARTVAELSQERGDG